MRLQMVAWRIKLCFQGSDWGKRFLVFLNPILHRLLDKLVYNLLCGLTFLF